MANRLPEISDRHKICVTAGNYADMCRRVKHLEDRDTIVGSSNFGKLVEWLARDDSGWIGEINRKLET